jgi:vancomycin resistance protein YoaR
MAKKEEKEIQEEKKELSDSNKIDNKKKRIAVKEESKFTKIKEKFKLSKTKKIIIFSISGFVIVLCITFGIITCINKLNTKVYNNVYMEGENFSGKTSEEVIELISNKSNDLSVNEKLDIYQNGENIYTIKAEDIEFKFDVDKTAKSIIEFGRTGNIFQNNFEIMKAKFSKKQIEPLYIYNTEKLDDVVKNIDLSIRNRYSDDSYSLDEKNAKIVIVNGKTGNAIDYNLEKENIISAFKNKNENTYDLKIQERKPQKLDAGKVYSEVKREAKDAYVDKSVSPQKYVAEIIGFDFDVNKLKEILTLPENQEEGKTIEFPINVIDPKVKLKDISADLCKDKLSGYTTYFPAGSYPRSNNLKIALSYMNSVVVMPGEIYSYNDNIGDTTASKGYQPAATFKGGTTVDEMGGGICQTVSTLYNVALMANLEIVERHQHGLPVGYVPPSRDATVYSPVLDFKFKNNRETPIKIVTSFTYNGSLNVSIYGTKQDNDPEVILSQKTTGTIPYTTKYEYDASMPYGQQVIITPGVNGYTSESYITKKLNGQIISSGLLSRDRYNAQQQVVKIGTAGS